MDGETEYGEAEYAEALSLVLEFTKCIRALKMQLQIDTPRGTVDDALRVIKRLYTPEEFTTVKGILGARWKVELPPPVITEESSDHDILTEVLRLFSQIESPDVRARLKVNIDAALGPVDIPPDFNSQ